MTAKSYDATVKALVEIEPESWPALLGHPVGPTTVIDADIATVSGAADKVLRVAADSPYLLHLEFVSGHDTAVLPRKLHVRNGLLEDRHDAPVRSAAFLLRPGSDSPQLTGEYVRGLPGEEPYLTFRYQVVRVWTLSPKPLLTGGLGLLPLAPVCSVTEAELPGIIKQMKRRLRGQEQAPAMWAAAYILLGLRYSAELANQLLQGVISMKESSTYQAILEEGRLEGLLEGRTEGAVAEAKKMLRRLGTKAFGEPTSRIAERIERMGDLAQLEEMLERVRTAESWQALFKHQRSERRGNHRRQSR